MMRLPFAPIRSALVCIVLVVVALAAAAAPAPARAEEGFVIGDSIAADLAQTIGLKFIAHHSVSLRKAAPKKISPQLARLPKGAVVLMGLGLNDAAIPVQGLRADIEWVIDLALKTGEKIVWFGPPCVLKRWDTLAKEMDDYLRQRLASTTIQYVSLRDSEICKPGMRTGDGEHFTTAGYRYVWEKIRRDSTYAASIELPKRAAPPPVASKAKVRPKRQAEGKGAAKE
jgi:hypothetical protein